MNNNNNIYTIIINYIIIHKTYCLGLTTALHVQFYFIIMLTKYSLPLILYLHCYDKPVAQTCSVSKVIYTVSSKTGDKFLS